MQAIYSAEYEKAEKIIKDKKPRKRDILLYYLNKGSLYWMKNQPVKSNEYFQKADYFVEDYQTKYAAQMLSFITNPKVVPYGGESFEQLLIHYYTTLNYAELQNFEAALVEVRRMHIKHQKINDFSKNQNKYNKDAFSHLLLGVVFDIKQEYNNAFIAYRNAYEIYQENYKKLFNIDVPLQLKRDLIRTAKLTGFNDKVEYYENLFKLKYQPDPPDSKPIFVFWNNGLGPVKNESSITLIIVPMGDGWYHLVNAELGIRVTYRASSKDEEASLRNIKFIRLAFPKYQSRIPTYVSAIVNNNGGMYNPLFLAQPIDKIAYQSLNDRMMREISEAALRFLAKRILQEAASRQNQAAGLAVGIANLATEQADTRNWQLLPHDIFYTRIFSNTFIDTLSIIVTNRSGLQTITKFPVDITNKKGLIIHYQTPQFSGYSSN
jgi:hypothetical protein